MHDAFNPSDEANKLANRATCLAAAMNALAIGLADGDAIAAAYRRTCAVRAQTDYLAMELLHRMMHPDFAPSDQLANR